VAMCADEDEARLVNPSTPQQLKCTASKPVTLPVIEGTIKSVVCELLNSLIVVDATQRNESERFLAQVSCCSQSLSWAICSFFQFKVLS